MNINTDNLEVLEPTPMKEPNFEFKPDADYSWRNEDIFTINGKEFEVAHNTLNAIFNTNIPQPQMYLMLHKMFEITSNILIRNVKNGKIKEVEKSLAEG